MPVFSDVGRVLATLAGLCCFTLNEVRMDQTSPRQPALEHLHAAAIHIGAPDIVYLSLWDLTARWGLAGITMALALWALAETFRRSPTAE